MQMFDGWKYLAKMMILTCVLKRKFVGLNYFLMVGCLLLLDNFIQQGIVIMGEEKLRNYGALEKKHVPRHKSLLPRVGLLMSN